MVQPSPNKHPSSDPRLEQKPGPSQKPASIRGEIKYPWGTVAHATVTLGSRSVFSDDAGKYEIPGLEPGAYIVDAKAPFPGYEAAPQNVTAAAGETSVVDFYLDFEKALVHGHVYDEEGKPIVGASLSGLIGGKDVLSAVTDDKGYFKFENANPGAQYVRVNAAGYMAQTLDFAAKKSEETTLDFKLNRAPFKIHGTISDENGGPLQAEVALSSASRIIIQKTFSDAKTGYYEFPVLPGTYGVLATVQDYLSEGWREDVTSDTKVDLRLQRAPPPPTTPPE